MTGRGPTLAATVAPAAPPEDSDHTDAVTRLRRRVLLAQATGSVGLAAGGAAGGLLAAAVTGEPDVAAAPLGALVLGSAVTAVPLSMLMARLGRPLGLRVGYVVAFGGALAVIGGARTGMLWALLAGNLLLGAGNSAAMLSRFAVADLSRPDDRAGALARSMLAIAVGAVLGPNLLGPAAALAEPLGVPGPAGLYVVAAAAFLLSACVLVSPGRSLVPDTTGDGTAPGATAGGAPVPAVLSTSVLAVANATMVTVMAVMPVHMHRHDHGLGTVGTAVALHIGAMYAVSPVLGRLVGRHGAVPVAAAGTATTGLTGAIAAGSDIAGLAPALLVLVLLGLGWNAQVLAGSAMLGAGRSADSRTRLEGRAEAAMAAAAAFGGLVIAAPLVRAGGVALLAACTVPFNLALTVLLLRRITPTSVRSR